MSNPLAGAKVRAADWTEIFPVDTEAWQAYTPTWSSTGTPPAIGNGSITGNYMKIGRLVVFRIFMLTGGTTTYGTGTYSWSLPVTAATSAATYGFATIIDSSASARFNRHFIPTSTTAGVAQTEAAVAATPTAPMTWASGDTITISGSYEAAS